VLLDYFPLNITFSCRSVDVNSLSICHLAELDGETLFLYGPGSLDALDRNWGTQAVNTVSIISIKFIDYDTIVPHFHKICARFPSLVVSTWRVVHALCCSLAQYFVHLFANPTFLVFSPFATSGYFDK
jgi:hypothetical protein